jgi:hypothetical protein
MLNDLIYAWVELMKYMKIHGIPFKIKDDVLSTYMDVSKILGEDKDNLLAITLAVYRIRVNRKKYLEKVKHTLLNTVKRKLIISALVYFMEYQKIDRKKSKFVSSKIIRCILDSVP